MTTLRALALGCFLGFVVGAVGCATCESTCAGCCTPSGACMTGDSFTECGAGGALCNSCSAQERCDVPNGSSARACVPTKRLFVTLTKYDGNLGGVAGADAKCKLAVDSVALGGTWKAWIGDSTTPPHTRIAEVGPWYNLSRKTRLFSNVANLQTAPLVNSSSEFEDERGTPSSHMSAWSGHDTESCSSWTSSSNNVSGSYLSAASGNWQFPALGCSQSLSLLCLEQ